MEFLYKILKKYGWQRFFKTILLGNWKKGEKLSLAGPKSFHSKVSFTIYSNYENIYISIMKTNKSFFLGHWYSWSASGHWGGWCQWHGG